MKADLDDETAEKVGHLNYLVMKVNALSRELAEAGLDVRSVSDVDRHPTKNIRWPVIHMEAT